MVQITFDTNNDSIDELKQALNMLQNSIQKRSGAQSTQEPNIQENETAKTESTKIIDDKKEDDIEDDTPFIKITINKGEDKENEQDSDNKEKSSPAPTLNQLISEEGISEEELARMFKGTAIEDEKNSKQDKKKNNAEEKTYLEIIDYDDTK